MKTYAGKVHIWFYDRRENGNCGCFDFDIHRSMVVGGSGVPWEKEEKWRMYWLLWWRMRRLSEGAEE
ncbi:MAG: hypothetical protein J5986_01185 [Roseburia sp.]|nr:hypothetical protein [Roseburia sp.]